MIEQAEFRVGILRARKFRDYLNRKKFNGMRIEYYDESSGFFSRIFVIRGSNYQIDFLRRKVTAKVL